MALVEKILIVDDDRLVGETISDFLGHGGRFEVFFASNFLDIPNMLRDFAPIDLIILDYQMPGVDGLNGFKSLRDLCPDTPIALMSGVANNAVIKTAMEMGAAGFIPKSLPSKSLINAVRFMVEGEIYFPTNFMREYNAGSEGTGLSAREIQVLHGICEGLANKQIAFELSIKEATVKVHVSAICLKLNVQNRTQAAIFALQTKIV